VKTAGTTEIQDYLAAVEREAMGLPAARRQELLADLAEHIEVARAERPDGVREILWELGDPRVIAGTALQESGGHGSGFTSPNAPAGRVRKAKVPALVPLLMLALASPLGLICELTPALGHNVSLVFIGPMRVIGAVLLCTSWFWTGSQKVRGLLVAFVAVLVVNGVVMAANSVDSGVRWVFAALIVALPVIGAVWLWKVRRAVGSA
jgi:uncharacterized membrane protein